MSLELRKINQHNFYEICQLKVAPHQRNLVDTNALSLAEANFMPCAWFKGGLFRECSHRFYLN